MPRVETSGDDWSEWYPTPSLRWCWPPAGGERVLEQRFERSRIIHFSDVETEEAWREIENVVE